MEHHFTARIERSGDMDAAYAVVPVDIRNVYGKGRLKVEATFDGEPYCGSVVNMGEERRESTLRNIERELFVLDEKIAASASKFLMLEKKEEKVNRRIIEGKMKEDIGDNLLQEIYDQRCQLEEDTRKWKLDKANLLTYRVFLSSGVGSFLNYSDITDDEEKIKIIRREIKQVFVDKEPLRAVHHGTVTITWSDGVVETYLYNSHKKTFSKKE